MPIAADSGAARALAVVPLAVFAFAVLLDRRAGDRAVGAKHSAIASLRLEPASAGLAVIEKLAGVGGHRLGGRMPAVRAGDGGLKLHVAKLAHDPEECEAAFRKDHAQTRFQGAGSSRRSASATGRGNGQ